VSAVPTACAGTDSVTIALNCALSATTKNPQMSVSGASIHIDLPNRRPTSRQQLPLAASAIVTSRSRPSRSAVNPPQMHPAPPTAIVPNAISDTMPLLGRDSTADAAALAARKAGIHVQNAYSSNM